MSFMSCVVEFGPKAETMSNASQVWPTFDGGAGGDDRLLSLNYFCTEI